MRASTPWFTLLVRIRADADPTMRIGVTVTKKTGNAVVRNRIKRRFRELARAELPTGGVPGADHVLIGRTEAATADHAAMRAGLAGALTQARRRLAKLAA